MRKSDLVDSFPDERLRRDGACKLNLTGPFYFVLVKLKYLYETGVQVKRKVTTMNLNISDENTGTKEKLYNTQEAARYLGISESGVSKAMCESNLQGVKIRGRSYFTPRALEDYKKSPKKRRRKPKHLSPPRQASITPAPSQEIIDAVLVLAKHFLWRQ